MDASDNDIAGSCVWIPDGDGAHPCNDPPDYLECPKAAGVCKRRCHGFLHEHSQEKEGSKEDVS